LHAVASGYAQGLGGAVWSACFRALCAIGDVLMLLLYPACRPTEAVPIESAATNFLRYIRKYTCTEGAILTWLMRDLAVWLLKALPPGIVVSEVWTRSNAALQASPWCCCVLALEIAMVVACVVRVLHGGGVLGLHEEGASLCAGWSRAMSACPYASLSMALLCPDAVLVYCSRMAESCSPSRGRPQMSCLHGQCGMGNLRQVTYAHPSARSCRFLNGAGVAV